MAGPRRSSSPKQLFIRYFLVRLSNGNATPMTYKVRQDGKQFVVVAAGGHAKLAEAKVGDAIVAFTLP